MKRLIALGLCIIMCITLTSCGDRNVLSDLTFGRFDNNYEYCIILTNIFNSFDNKEIQYITYVFDGADMIETDSGTDTLNWTLDNPWKCAWVFDESIRASIIAIKLDSADIVVTVFEEHKYAKKYYNYYYRNMVDEAKAGYTNEVFMTLIGNIIISTDLTLSDFELDLIRHQLIQSGYFKNAHQFNKTYIKFMEKTNYKEN